MAKHETLTFTDQDFEAEVVKAPTPVLVDFWAPWCGPCQIMAPTIDSLARDYEGRVSVGKLDIDQNPQTTAKLGIRSIPTLLLFKNGEVVDGAIGVADKARLTALLETHLD